VAGVEDDERVKSSASLVIDIGNTSTSLGIYRAGKVGRVGRIETVEQTFTTVSAAIRKLAGRTRIGEVGIASVVPLLNPVWESAVRDACGVEPYWIHHDSPLGVKITYPDPASIGADRLANAAGAARKFGAPVIVADFGTAVTFDLVTRRDGYIGGIIAPGLPLMFDYLAERTAQLPRIAWNHPPARHRTGKSTAEAMQLGAHWGYRGMVREILCELRKSPALRQAVVCGTGGFADRVLSGIRPAPRIDKTLTLFGIGCILEKK
jgi:type III pantothenate kinase